MKRLFAALILVATAFAAPTVHSTSLLWTQSSSTGITGNCVYRSQTSGGPYTSLFCSGTASTSYNDTQVIGGQTYYYVVTALAGTQESTYSNEVKVTVPLSPAAPTGLSAVAQ